MEFYSLYLHIPFCRHRCAYCDFNTYSGLEAIIPAYVQALGKELEYLANAAGEELFVRTIFFGGGTPSLLSIRQLETLFSVCHQYFRVDDDVEITLEANPGTLSLPYLQDLRILGINRLSLGMQSANPVELGLLERQHDYLDVVQAMNWARKANFENINLDLIFGLPNQSVEDWQATLQSAIHLDPEHLSVYALTLEHGTPMYQWVMRGLMPAPDPDLAADLYEMTTENLASARFEQYEISNWALRKPDGTLYACQHNLQYWRNKPYLGCGAGAHGYANNLRTANVLSPKVYTQRLDPNQIWQKPYHFPRTPVTTSAIKIDQLTEMGETLMMGLRLTQEGVSAHAFERRYGQSLRLTYGAEIKRLIEQGLLEWAGEDSSHLRLTSRGRLLGNQVFSAFI